MIDPKWEEKVWGRVRHLFASDHAAVSILEVKAGFRCSRHMHDERANMFAVESGLVMVEKFLDENVRLQFWLGPGDECVIGSGTWHRFRVAESGKMIEVYWPDGEDYVCRKDDIVRSDEGGPDPWIVAEAKAR